MNNLEVIKNSNSDISQMYRSIRTNIAFSSKHKNIKSIVITSYQDKEGKSTVTANLAVLFSNIGKKVLVIDTNYKNNSIENLLDVKSTYGLSDVVQKKDHLSDCIEKTSLKNLYYLGCGQYTENFSELASSDEMKKTIEQLNSMFDYIFIDTISIGQYSDGCVLSNYSDGTILVVGAGEVDIDKVSIAKEKLNNVGANIIGAILNKFEKM